MPIWPFGRRRRRANSATQQPSQSAPLLEKGRAATTPASPRPTASPPSGSRQSSKRWSRRREAPLPQAEIKPQGEAEKENIPPLPRANGSREDITALPAAKPPDHSPHLRAVDLARPPHPYGAPPNSTSQSSVQRPDSLVVSGKSRTVPSKRSTADYSQPARRASSRKSRRRDDALREEEIRAMSQPIPIPDAKRQGDAPLRTEGKKTRDPSAKGSEVSLPVAGSVHSGASGVYEQRGWEIGALAAFSPRPSVRLSGTPQYVLSSSLPQHTSGFLYRIDSIRSKDKKQNKTDSVTKSPTRKKTVIGDEADELDASDIRAIMERDAKRRDKRNQEQVAKAERKLRGRQRRERDNSDLQRRNAEPDKRPDGSRALAEQRIQAQGPLTPPTAVHPALRDPSTAEPDPVGLGIEKELPIGETPMDVDMENRPFTATTGGDTDPFSDAVETLPAPAHAQEPLETPMEDAVVGMAQAVRMSQTHTPPLSPVHGQRKPSTVSQLTTVARQESAPGQGASNFPPPPPIPVERRSSDPAKELRSGSWTAIFRRGGTNLRKSRTQSKASPAQTSFANTSRDSMRNQPLPAHLVDSQARRPSTVRTKSGVPVRTQSKFREDLPEMPVSPTDSRAQSPDIVTTAGAVAAARRSGRVPSQSGGIAGRSGDADQGDIPVNERLRRHKGMTGSLASIGSEGSWLAGSPGNRQSTQSGLSRSFSKRNSSYEELGGGDNDAEYMHRNLGSRPRKVSSPALGGADPAEESGEDEVPKASPGTPLAVHESVRRKPTLVQRDPRLKSREGLLVSDYAGSEDREGAETPYETPDETPFDEDEDEPEREEEPQLERARSVQYSGHHSRQFSAGSARLLEMTGKRASVDNNNKEYAAAEPTSSSAA